MLQFKRSQKWKIWNDSKKATSDDVLSHCPYGIAIHGSLVESTREKERALSKDYGNKLRFLEVFAKFCVFDQIRRLLLSTVLFVGVPLLPTQSTKDQCNRIITIYRIQWTFHSPHTKVWDEFSGYSLFLLRFVRKKKKSKKPNKNTSGSFLAP